MPAPTQQAYHRLTATYARSHLRQIYPQQTRRAYVARTTAATTGLQVYRHQSIHHRLRQRSVAQRRLFSRIWSVWTGDRYWVSSITRNWDDTAGWSKTSGGSWNATIPSASNRVIFNNGGLGNCTFNRNVQTGGCLIYADQYTGNIDWQSRIMDCYGIFRYMAASSSTTRWSSVSTLNIHKTGTEFEIYCLNTNPVEVYVDSGVTLSNTSQRWAHFKRIHLPAGSYVSNTVLAPRSPTENNPLNIDDSITLPSSVLIRFYGAGVTQRGFTTLGGVMLNYTGSDLTMTGHLTCGSLQIHGSSSADTEAEVPLLIMNGYNLTCSGTVEVGYSVSAGYWGGLNLGSGTHYIYRLRGNGPLSYGFIYGSGIVQITETLDLRYAALGGALGTFTAELQFVGAFSGNIYCGGNQLTDVILNKSAGGITLTDECYCNSLTWLNTNAGSFDAGTNYVFVLGNVTTHGTGAIDLGDGNTWVVSGNWDSTQGSGTWTYGTATIQMSGAGTTIASVDAHYLYTVSIAEHVTRTTTLRTYGVIVTSGCLFDGASPYFVYSGGTASIYGEFSGGLLYVYAAAGKGIDLGPSGRLTNTTTYFFPYSATAFLSPGTYECSSSFCFRNSGAGNQTWNSTAGNYIFDCNVVFLVQAAGNLTVNNSTSNANLEFKRHVQYQQDSSGVLNWTYGTGVISLSGTADQDFNFNMQRTEKLYINKASGTARPTLDLFSNGIEVTTAGGVFDDNARLMEFYGDITIGNATGIIVSTGAWRVAANVNISNPAYSSPLTVNLIMSLEVYNGFTATLANHFYARQYFLYDGSKIYHPSTTYECRTWRGADTANDEFIWMEGSAQLDCNVMVYTPRDAAWTGVIDQGYINCTKQLRIGYGWGDCTIRMTDNWIIGGQLWVQSSYDEGGDPVTKIQRLDCDHYGSTLTIGGNCLIGYYAGGYTGYRGEIQFGNGAHTIGGNLTTYTNGSSGGGYVLESCQIALSGNIELKTGYAVSDVASTITATGTAAQTVSMVNGQQLGNLTVNKSGGSLALASDAWLKVFRHIAGTSTFAGYNCTVTDFILQNGSTGSFTFAAAPLELTVSGNYENYNSNVTVNGYMTNKVRMTGASKQIYLGSGSRQYSGTFIVAGTITVNAAGSTGYSYVLFQLLAGSTFTLGNYWVAQNADIAGTLNGATASGRLYFYPVSAGQNLTIRSTGSLQNFSVYIRPLSNGLTPELIFESGATIQCTSAWYFWTGAEVFNRTVIINGDVIFDCQVEMFMQTAANFTVDCSVYNPDIEFRKGFSRNWLSSGRPFWTRGTGVISITGSNNQNLDFQDMVLEDIFLQKTAGRATLVNTGFICRSFTGVSGDFDLNGLTVYVDGDVELHGDTGFRLWDGSTADMSNGVFDYDGSFSAHGTAVTQLAITNLDLVNTIADISYVEYCTVTNSQRTGPGANINAWAGPGNIDNGSNIGWDFTEPVSILADHFHIVVGIQSYYHPLEGQSQRTIKLTGTHSRTLGLPGSREEPYALPGVSQDPLILQKTE